MTSPETSSSDRFIPIITEWLENNFDCTEYSTELEYMTRRVSKNISGANSTRWEPIFAVFIGWDPIFIMFIDNIRHMSHMITPTIMDRPLRSNDAFLWSCVCMGLKMVISMLNRLDTNEEFYDHQMGGGNTKILSGRLLKSCESFILEVTWNALNASHYTEKTTDANSGLLFVLDFMRNPAAHLASAGHATCVIPHIIHMIDWASVEQDTSYAIALYKFFSRTLDDAAMVPTHRARGRARITRRAGMIDAVIGQWSNHFNSQPISYSKREFYVMMANDMTRRDFYGEDDARNEEPPAVTPLHMLVTTAYKHTTAENAINVDCIQMLIAALLSRAEIVDETLFRQACDFRLASWYREVCENCTNKTLVEMTAHLSAEGMPKRIITSRNAM